MLYLQSRRSVVFALTALVFVAGAGVVAAGETFKWGVDTYPVGNCLADYGTSAYAHGWVADPSTLVVFESTPGGIVRRGEASASQDFISLGPFPSSTGQPQWFTTCLTVVQPASYGTYWDLTFDVY
jgi:hypothetical protein